MHESGLLAVTVMGVLMANMREVNIHSILEFKEDLTIVFVSTLFIVLAARLDFAAFAALGWSALLLLAAMQFVARPLKVALSFMRSDFTWREQALIAWIGPRGIVAAAVSAAFALRLEELGLEGADKLVPLAFLIIIGTVVLQSLTAKPLARMLKVAMPKTHGVVIIGANQFSLAVAEALNKVEVDSIICDTNWDMLKTARIAGLNTYYGDPSSDHAKLHLNLSPYGYMLGLSNHFEYNVVQANRFRDDFGARKVYILPPNQSSERSNKQFVNSQNNGRILFDQDNSYSILKKKLNNGGMVKVTELSQAYDYKQWRVDNQEALMLLALLPNGELSFQTIDTALFAVDGCKLFSLLLTNSESTVSSSEKSRKLEGQKADV
jgi:CPA1 family monovalent cation:H+ antiporter